MMRKRRRGGNLEQEGPDETSLRSEISLRPGTERASRVKYVQTEGRTRESGCGGQS